MPQIAPLVAGDPVRLGPFTLTGRIGEGGQGTVYLGYNSAGERAAVKLLHVKFSGDAAARSRFARELKASERVASFCTARVLAADLDGDTPYIASEYIEGRSLREVVDTEGPLTGAALHRLAIGTATALTAIHHAGIVHRDFKPDNVLIAADGPRVVDFGIARIIDSTGTITSRAVGTPAYMAPEQISGGPVGPHTDVFSWGSTIIFAGTGQVAFAGDSIAVVLNRILNHEADVDMLPEPLRGVVRACLSKAPEDRPTADQILLRLLGHSEQGGASRAVLNEGAQIAGADRGATLDVPPTRRQPRPSAAPLPHTGLRTGSPVPTPAPAPAAPAVPAAPPNAGAGAPSYGTASYTGIPPSQPDAMATPPPPSWQTSPPGGTRRLPSDGVETEAGYGRARTRRMRLLIAGLVAGALLAAAGVVTYAQLNGNAGDGGGGGADGGARPPQAATNSAAAVGGVSSPLLDKVSRTGQVVIGVKGDLPGIGLASGDRRSFTGFEVDFAREIARELGAQPGGVSFVQVSKFDRIDALTGGKVDMVLATWAIDEKEAERVGFAGPYFEAHTGVLVREDNSARSLAELKRMVLCAPKGSPSTQVVLGRVEMQTREAANYAECMDRLRAGAVDAIPGDDVILAGFGNRDNLAVRLLPDRLDTLRYGVGIRRGDKGACEAIRDAIGRLYSSRAASRILAQYFDRVPITAAETAPRPVSC